MGRRSEKTRPPTTIAEFSPDLRIFSGWTGSRAWAKFARRDRLLRECCREQLRMGPSQYLSLRRMQQVHRALRSQNRETARVSEIAERYGIRDLGRFASDYRALYGELPSTTLRRSLRPGDYELGLRKSRVKFS